VKTETIIARGFVALLICGTGLFLSCAGDNGVAKIEFYDARVETNGSLKIAYRYTTPSGTFLLETDFENGTETAESRGSGAGVSDSSSGYSVSIQNIPSPPPSMLVTTGKTYYLKPHEKLPMYDFTNNSGKTYHGDLSLERLSQK
jgi:hypothetical protein